ncbi:hypothetical protein XENOCAPTIV_000726 [Xenoophorus captivus]|uniref:Uncharacterized protein n=1 Tax=Xenoophorus captivus TaxID=1517983 RepID=A0ABV0RUS1_9TELE
MFLIYVIVYNIPVLVMSPSLSELLQVRPSAVTCRMYISPHGRSLMSHPVADVVQQLGVPPLSFSSVAVYINAPGTSDQDTEPCEACHDTEMLFDVQEELTVSCIIFFHTHAELFCNSGFTAAGVGVADNTDGVLLPAFQLVEGAAGAAGVADGGLFSAVHSSHHLMLIWARVSPGDKRHIGTALQIHGHIVWLAGS